MTLETIVVIPARGGSRGIPGKNLARVGGVPLVARAVQSARRARGVDRVVVSTDDAEIARVAEGSGADVVDRPAELSGDAATSESAVLHALDVLAERNVAVDVVALVQATSPFVPPEPLADAIARVRSGEVDCAFAARASYEFFWSRRGSAMEPVAHDAARRLRRQERDPLYVETGAFYVMSADGFREVGHRFFGRVAAQEVPADTAIEIDTPADLAAARALVPLVPDRGPIDVDAVVTDFDGVHTDDTAGLSQDGTEYVRVSRSDGMGVRLLGEAGVRVLILSTERNPVVRARAHKLGVDVIHSSDDKGGALVSWAAKTGVSLDRVAYVGNDVNDIGALDVVGWPVVVPGAHPEATARARLVLTRSGGHGAVRELADLVLAGRAGILPSTDRTHS